MFQDKRWKQYAFYGAAVILGALAGAGVGYFYYLVPDEAIRQTLVQAEVSFFVSLPTLCILYSLVLTMMFQIQSSGAKASVQPVYWFPVTWEEHTVASAASSMLTGTLWITLLICSGVLAGSVMTGQLPLAVLTTMGLFLCMALSGFTIEALKAAQMGLSGAILKAAGKSAVWVRFFSVLIMFTVVYVAYFAFTQSDMAALFKAIADGQASAWFIPYVWPGIALYAFSQGHWAETALFAIGSLAFCGVLFALASRLNARYGLSDTMAISVSSAYAPGTGLLGSLVLPAAESAILRKDFKAFTLRSELMYIFIMPIVMVVGTFMPLITGSGGSSFATGGIGSFFFLYLVLMPAPLMAMMLGISVVGSEGERMWFLKSSPMSVKSFVRAKFMFPAILSTAIAIACWAVACVIFGPAPRTAATGLIESILLVYAIGLVALTCGVAGADFNEVPRPRMIRTEWSLASILLSMVSGVLVLLPVIAYSGISFLSSVLPFISSNGVYLYVAWLLSGVIAFAISYVARRASIAYARKLLEDTE
jgi:hypothetical protein